MHLVKDNRIMGTDYSPNNFIKKTPNRLLEEYFQSEKVQVEPVVEIEVEGDGEEKEIKKVKISELEEKQFEPIIKLIEIGSIISARKRPYPPHSPT